MNPIINHTQFGYITISGKRYEYDVLIRLNGEVEKRKKKLSKAQYGTSHKISLDEAQHIFEAGAEKLIIGQGQTGYVELSDEAENFFARQNCTVQLYPTPVAINVWNDNSGDAIGLFHVTC
jgi:hypothetical protein